MSEQEFNNLGFNNLGVSWLEFGNARHPGRQSLADINLSLSIEKLSISDKRQITPKCQNSASSFCKRVPAGFGYLPMLTRFDPSRFIRPESKTLTKLLVPTIDEIRNALPLVLSGEKPGFQSIGETESNGIHDMTMKEFACFNFLSNGQIQLSSHGLGLGIVSENSYNDGYIRLNNLHLAELENKGAESSLLPALAQSATTATNFCMGLLAKGIPLEDCIVAVVANTGVNICFGATILLDDSFPTYIPLSKQLDLLDDYESRVAYAFLEKIADHAKSLSSTPLRVPPPVVGEMALSLEGYFVKKLTQPVFDRGLGLFSTSGQNTDVQNGLNHMIRCLNRLYGSHDARDVAEYPLSVRTPESGCCDYFELIYRDLTQLGFQTGTPDRITEPDLFEAFVAELKRCVALVHSAGVIHVDLFASNIMWKRSDDERCVRIKIVDWDGSHCLEEGDFVPAVKAMLENRLYDGQTAAFGIPHDLKYVSVYEMPLEERHRTNWKGLASGQKDIIDGSFHTLMRDRMMGLV
eukprot:gene35104-45441_t